MNRKILIENIKSELSRIHKGIKVIHVRTKKDDIDLFILISENIYLAIPIKSIDRIIEDFGNNAFHLIMIKLLFRLKEFMKKII